MIGMIAAFAAVATAAAESPDWNWLYPLAGGPPVIDPADRTAYTVPGSDRSFSNAEMHDSKRAVDWFPAEHPPMPGIVAAGHGQANACAYCHLPDGNGRPENSSLAGLPADYIKRQVQAFADGSRRAALPNTLPLKFMGATAKAATPGEIEEAAAYFSKLPYTSHVRVVETSKLGFEAAAFIYVLLPGSKQPIGDRIIEVPADPDRFERRDPHMRFTAFVAPGTIAAGRAVAASGGHSGQPCTGCHGTGLRGDSAPPLAGRAPTNLVRQLLAFQSGARANTEAAPMRAVAAQLDQKEMVAVAAYAATLKP